MQILYGSCSGIKRTGFDYLRHQSSARATQREKFGRPWVLKDRLKFHHPSAVSLGILEATGVVKHLGIVHQCTWGTFSAFENSRGQLKVRDSRARSGFPHDSYEFAYFRMPSLVEEGRKMLEKY